jgi:hypothetical protein
MNLIKTGLRNQMDSVTLAALFNISINGVELEQFRFHEPLKVWQQEKYRRHI